MSYSPGGGANPSHPQEQGQTPAPIILWDTSSAPAQNEPAEKLGALGGQLGAIAGLFDPDTVGFCLLDGYHKGQEVTSLLPFDPDNWTPRLHDEMGKGKDNSWAIRLVCDHSNDSDTRKIRSTLVVDGEADQEWGELNDIFQIIDRSASVKDDELKYTAAGFLQIFSEAHDPMGREDGPETPEQSGKDTRGAVGITIHRNLGFVGDKKNVGQLSHFMVFLKPPDSADVATPEQHTHPAPGDVASGEPGPGSPDWHPPRNAPITPIGGAGNHLQFGPDGVLQVNGRPIDQPPPEDHSAPASDANPNRPKNEIEVGLRLDVGFLVNKGGKVARLADDQPPSDASMGDGEVRKVTFYVGEEPGSPDDHLDTMEDDHSNHKKIPKTVKKNKFAGWVKVPPPTSDHYDYSYHNPPPESSSSDSSDSSDGSGSGSGSGGESDGTGPGTPPGGDQNPNGTRGDVPSVDGAYLNPDGSPTPWNDSAPGSGGIPSTQVQSGFAPPHSPGYMIRGNISPSDGGDGKNPVGSFVAHKAAGYTDFALELVCCISDDLTAGQVIEINTIVMPHEGGYGPSAWYRQCFIFDGDHGFVAEPKEYTVRMVYRGFRPESQDFTVLVERRNDTDKGTNPDAEFVTIRSSLVPIPMRRR